MVKLYFFPISKKVLFYIVLIDDKNQIASTTYKSKIYKVESDLPLCNSADQFSLIIILSK